MSPQSSSLDAEKRVLPRSYAARPQLPPVPPNPAHAALFGRLRRRLALTGIGPATPLAPPRPAPHRDPVLALVQRITQGFHPAEYERAKAMGYDAYLEEQLDHLSIDDSDLESRLARFGALSASPKELHDAYPDDFSRPYFELKVATLARSVESRRQLYERMVEFWNDHFSIFHDKDDVEWMLLPEFDRTVIRPNALGSFPAMLEASAFSGAMLYYLDNWLNVRGAPQENYARELMELHTLSVTGGYVESDVGEVAKCFTGWTLVQDPSSPDWMRSTFDSRQHTPGKKFVLGHEISDRHVARPDVGVESTEAKQVLDILVAHPSTARFLAYKLIRWFLTPAPPAQLVDAVAAAYQGTGGDVKAMLRVVLSRENFRFTSPVLAPKFRRPFHYVVSLLRVMDSRFKLPGTGTPLNTELLSFLEDMGQVPLGHVQPDGYPDTVEKWGTSLLPRWTFAANLLHNYLGSAIGGVFTIQPDELKARLGFAHDPADRRGLAGRMNERFFGGMHGPHESDVLQDFIDTYPGTFGNTAFFDTLALGASLPGFQWY